MKQSDKLDLGLFLTLVTFGVAARWLQPEWAFTPTAALAVFAGYYLRRPLAALLVPLSIMGLSDVILPSYYIPAVQVMVYAAMTLPVVLGFWLRRGASYGRLAVCGLAPAVVFFLLTNFAVWASLDWYPRSAAGLLECYAAALPFFRMMLLGDVFFTAVVFGCYVLAAQSGMLPVRRQPAFQPVRREP